MFEIPEGYGHLLDEPLYAHFGTIRADGSPQVNPMWFTWDGEVLRFTHTTTRQKYRNIEADPRVSISIIDPHQPFRYLEVRGVVERIDPDSEGAFYVELAKRYGIDNGQPPPDAADRVIFVVRPTATSKQ